MTEAAWDPGHGLEQLTKQHPSPTRHSAELQRRQASGSLPLPLDLMPNRKGVLTRQVLANVHSKTLESIASNFVHIHNAVGGRTSPKLSSDSQKAPGL